MNAKQDDTKKRILETATDLFGQLGFHATSIRNIATTAQVNISAINYHFKTKDELYWSVISTSHLWLEQESEKISRKENITTLEFVSQLFDFFQNHHKRLMNTFKILLIDSINEPDTIKGNAFLESEGPPGHQPFLNVLTKEFGSTMEKEAMMWIARMTFCQLIHMTVISKTSIVKNQPQISKDFSDDFLKK